jgi:PST family polysaccharide transporter
MTSELSQQEDGPLGHRAARGALVTVLAQAARIVIQVASVVVLARLLSPNDYGLIAMVLALIGIGEIVRDFGLSSAAVQAPTLSAGQRSTLYWANAAIGLALGIIVLLAAPLIAAFYGQPELTAIARALAPVFLLNGLATQYRASLVRSLRFAALASADIASAALGLAAAVVAALLGAGYWALVGQQLAQAACLLLLLGVAARWLPGRPHRLSTIRSFLGFGAHLAGSQLVGYVANNIDSIVIGLRFGAAPLGIYSRAFQLLMTPLNQVRSPLTSVALPILSRLADDPARAARYVALGQRCLGYSIVAALAVVIAAPEPLTAVLLGPNWSEAAPILRLLAVAGVFQTLAFVGYWVYLSRALTRALLQYSIASAGIRIACILLGAQWGVLGVAAGYALAPLLSWPLSLWWLSRRSGMPVAPLYAGAGRIIACAALAAVLGGAAALAAAPLGAIVQLAIATVAAALAYLALALVPAIRRDLTDVASVVRAMRLRSLSTRTRG